MRKLETRLQETVEPDHNPSTAHSTTIPPTEPEEQNAPGPSHIVDSRKRERMRILEGDDEEEKRDGPSKNPKRTPIINLIRDNHMKYNKFITKKMPKILRQLGVDSNSDSSDYKTFLCSTYTVHYIFVTDIVYVEIRKIKSLKEISLFCF